MEPVDVRLARIEEHQVFVRGDLKEIKRMLQPMIEQCQRNALDIALLQRDEKWKTRIVAGTGGFIGACAAMLVNWFSLRK